MENHLDFFSFFRFERFLMHGVWFLFVLRNLRGEYGVRMWDVHGRHGRHVLADTKLEGYELDRHFNFFAEDADDDLEQLPSVPRLSYL